MNCLYVLEVNPLSVVSFAILFSHSESCLFTLFIVSFAVQKLLSLTRSRLFIFAFFPLFHYIPLFHLYPYIYSIILGSIKDLAMIYVTQCSAYVFF